MTTYSTRRVTCACCGAAQTCHVLTSTNAFGWADLDTRPPEMERSTIHASIQRCPYCGYCAPDVSTDDALAIEVLDNPEYVAVLTGKALPGKANDFLCWAMIAGRAGLHDSATWALLRTAWICDDARATGAAAACRARALDAFWKATAGGRPISPQPGVTQLIGADLHRRCGRFDAAAALADKGLAVNPAEVVADALRFQKQLSEAGDVACHTIDEARRAAPDWPEREARRKAEQERVSAEKARRKAEQERVSAEKARRRDEEIESMSPRRYVSVLARHPWKTAAAATLGLSMDLPWPPSIRAIMGANCKAYGWPEHVATIALALALLRVRPDIFELSPATLDAWTKTCGRFAPVVEYLAHCVRDSTAREWHYAAARNAAPPKLA